MICLEREERINAGTIWTIRPRREVIPIPHVRVLARIYPAAMNNWMWTTGCVISYSYLQTIKCFTTFCFSLEEKMIIIEKGNAVIWCWYCPKVINALGKVILGFMGFPAILTSKRWKLHVLIIFHNLMHIFFTQYFCLVFQYTYLISESEKVSS